MILLYLLKLIVFNFVHTLALGLIGMGLGFLFAFLDRNADESKTPPVAIRALLFLVTLPLILLLPITAAKAAHMALSVVPERIDVLWWILTWVGGCIPVAYSRPSTDPRVENLNAIAVPCCFLTFLIFAIWNPSLPSELNFIQRLAASLTL